MARINWEEFEEKIQELQEELSISNPNHDDFVTEFTSEVDDLIDEMEMSSDHQHKAVLIAGRYGYSAGAEGANEDYDE